jgi:hypothetical protein
VATTCRVKELLKNVQLDRVEICVVTYMTPVKDASLAHFWVKSSFLINQYFSIKIVFLSAKIEH